MSQAQQKQPAQQQKQPAGKQTQQQQQGTTATANAGQQQQPQGRDATAAAKTTATDSQNATGPIMMNIRVNQARNIRGAKGEHVNSFVRVQFADFDFKDSPVALDSSHPEYKFDMGQELNMDETLIDTIANKKLALTLIEQLPKEKTAILGTTDVCLGPRLLRLPPRIDASLQESESINDKKASGGNDRAAQAGSSAAEKISDTHVQITLPITYLNPKLLPAPVPSGRNTAPEDGAPAPSTAPEFIIEITLSRPLLTEADLESGNLITLKLDDVWPVPEEWSLKEGNEKDITSNVFSYNMSFQIPKDVGGDRTITVGGGKLVGPDNPDASATAAIPSLQAQNEASGAAATSTENVAAAAAHKRVVWSQSILIWLSPGAVQRYREKVVAKGKLEVEFTRQVQARFPTLQDPLSAKYNGHGSVDSTALIFPKSTVLKGRFSLVATDPPNAGGNSNSSPPIAANTGATTQTGAAAGTPTNANGGNLVTYKELGTTFGLEMIFERPLIEKKKLEPVTKKVSDIVPRSYLPQHILHYRRSAKAIDQYRAEIRTISRRLLSEYQKLLAEEEENYSEMAASPSIAATQDGTFISGGMAGMINDAHDSATSVAQQMKTNSALGRNQIASAEGSDQPGAFETEKPQRERRNDEAQRRRKLFTFKLNRNGVYFNFKEALKASVIEVVREKFQRKSPFASKDEMQTFMSEIYVFLVEEMHSAINELFKTNHIDSEVSEAAQNVETLKNLIHFASEAERDGDRSRASRYHLERIAAFGDEHPYVWFDYGAFCLRNGMQEKGEECLKELLSRGVNHVPTLLAYGAMCTLNEKFEDAQVMLQTAQTLQPENPMCASIMALHWDFVGEEEESDKIMASALRQHVSHSTPSSASSRHRRPTDASTHPSQTPSSIAHTSKQKSLHLITAEFLISVNAGQLAERALSHELLEHANVRSLTPGPMEDAKKIQPYLLLSRMEFYRGNTENAVQHVKEALEIRQDDANAWAALGHLHFVNGQWAKAMTAYETVVSLKQEPDDRAIIFSRLGFLYIKSAYSSQETVEDTKPTNQPHQNSKDTEMSAGKTSTSEKDRYAEPPKDKIDVQTATLAKGMYLRACEISPTCRSWLGVGRACLALEEWIDAEDALQEANVLNNRDPDVWAYIAFLSIQLDRKFEAQQALTQALKNEIKDATALRLIGRAFLSKMHDVLPAVECLRMALELEPENAALERDFLYALHYSPKH